MAGLFRAQVEAVDDPQGLGRIKLRIPLSGEQKTLWARVLRSLDANFEVDDVVLAGFEDGDPDAPVVLGALDAGAGSGARTPPLFAAPLQTSFEWDDLVLPPETIAGLRDITAWARHEQALLGEWGLGRLVRPGFRALFAGPPGTGKTMAAALIAKQLGLAAVRIDLALIVSKYIGETEKNLAAAFAMAEARGAVLSFDEADALFGKRSEVKDSHDRYANQETAYLLHRMEEHSGLTILATNLPQKLDPALARRFDRVVRFPMPGAAERLELWRRLVSVLPHDRTSALDLTDIARDYELAAGSMVGIVRDVALRALEDDRAVEEADIRAAIARARDS